MAERRRTRSVRDIDDEPDQRPHRAEDSEEFADPEDEAAFDDDERGMADEDELDPDAGTDADHEDGTEADGEDRSSPSRRRRPSADDGLGGRRRRPARRHAAMTVNEAARAALQQVMELTAKPAESITSVERTEDGWKIGIEVVEDRRIPSSADILATYRAEIAEHGELVSYQRIRRYSRGRGDSSEG